MTEAAEVCTDSTTEFLTFTDAAVAKVADLIAEENNPNPTSSRCDGHMRAGVSAPR